MFRKRKIKLTNVERVIAATVSIGVVCVLATRKLLLVAGGIAGKAVAAVKPGAVIAAAKGRQLNEARKAARVAKGTAASEELMRFVE